MENLNPVLYGGDPLQDRTLEKKVETGVTPTDAVRVPLSDVLAGTEAFKQGALEREMASQPKSDIGEVIGAATSQWLTTGLFHYVTDPSFEHDTSSASSQIQRSGLDLDNDEMDYLLKAKGAEDRQFRIERIKSLKQDARIASSRPLLAGLVAGLDPALLITAAVTGGIGEAANLGTVAKMGIAAAQTTAVVGATAETRPMSNTEAGLNVILETLAAPLMGAKGTKKAVQVDGKLAEAPVLVPHDPDFPAAELKSVVTGTPVVPEVKPFGAMASGEMGDIMVTPSAKAPGKFQLTHFADGVPVEDHLFDTELEAIDAFNDAVDMDGATVMEKSWKSDTITDAPSTPVKSVALPAELEKAAPRYSYGSKGFELDFESDIDKALYIVADGVKRSKSDAKYMAWLGDVTGMAPDELRAAGAEIRSAIKADAKTSKETSLSVKSTRDKVMLEDIGLAPESRFPTDLTPGVTHEPAKVAAAVQKVLEAENKTWAQRVGSRLEWNIHKSMREFGPVGAKIADTLFDNNGNLKITSVESHVRGVSAQLKTSMGKFDNLLLDAMAEEGYGTWNQIWKNKGASAVQEQLEREVNLEMLRRDQLGRQGFPITHENVPPRITAMADALDRVAKQALDEMQAAGVNGVEELKHTSGWASRRWSSLKVQQAIDKIASMGHDVKKAKGMLVETVARSVADATPGLEWELAHDIAASTIDRALRKGAMEDASFMVGQGMDNAKGIRDMLKAEGVSAERIQRIMDRVVGKVDEQGKASFLKHRIAMDYTTNLDLGGHVINVTDLFDHNIKDIFDRYIDKAAAESGFARKGLRNTSDIDKLRAEGIAALNGDPAKTKEFAALFDGTVAHMFGEAHGGDMGKAMRNMSAFNRLISLGASGYWQVTEYAKMMQQYGALKTLKYAVQEMPLFKTTLETASKDKEFSTHLKDILEFASTDSMRLQPFVRRFADGLEMPANASLSGKLQHATQLVPYLNGMKYVHGHQARVMANLTLDCITRAANGDTKMVAALEKYGVTAENFKTLKADVLEHGMDVSKWSDGNWANVRPAFMKMMDESVLHARLGDTPAFALLNPVGKFICTYRGFTLTAHNKLLAGTMQRDGLVGVGLMMAYQYPLSALAVQAQATLNNKKPLSAKELATLSMTQVGSMGLISEVAGVLSGGKKQVGSPGLIPADRAYAAIGELGKAAQGKGSASRFAHDVFQLIPGMAVLAPAKSFEGYVNPQKQ